jgi:hypothetical protein
MGTDLRTAAQQALEAHANRYQVVRDGYWWRVKIGDGTQTVGQHHTETGALRLASELHRAFHDGGFVVQEALKAALEQPEQEPVACIRTWHKKNGDQHAELWDWCDGIGSLPEGEHLLYTYSPRREWRSLSEEEVNALWASHDKTGKQITRAIEAALKERNA